MRMKSKNAEPGVLAAAGESITYRRGEALWTVPLNSIAAIGEATNQSGPWADDWFICFVTRPEGRCYEAPLYASGVEAVLDTLARRLGAPIQLDLANSADFKSCAIWPPTLRGAQLFEFSAPDPVSWRARILKACHFCPWHVDQHLNPEILRELRPPTA